MAKKKTPIKQNKNFFIFFLSSILIIGSLYLLIILNQDYTTKNWGENTKTYVNKEYDFKITFPLDYEAVKDKDGLSGWPKAIVLIYNGGQSYDLPIEIWQDESDYKNKYWKYTDLIPYIKVVKLKNGEYITLVNQNKDPEVEKIISTFKILD